MKNNNPATEQGRGHEASLPPGAGLSAQDTNALRERAEQLGLKFLTSVSDDILDPSLVADLPVEWARSNCLLPVRINGETCVLTDDPDEVSRQEYLELLVGGELRPVLAPRDIILQGIERCYYSKDDSPKKFLQDLDLSKAGSDNQVLQVGSGQNKTDDLLQVAEKAPVTQLVNLILLEAVKRQASDIHFEPFKSKLRVRYRIDGVLYEQASLPKRLEETLVSRLKVMARMDIAEKRLPQDGTARVRVGEREIDIRVATVPVAEGERVVLRLLDRDTAFLPLKVLGISEIMLRTFESMLDEPNGIIVVSGPTGSGKTTTLYAALGRLNASRKNILTIEDPIEYQLPDIGQIQVNPKIGLTFAGGLRHILRQDPDIILVGEARDLETAEIAVRASLTGHLVFTTLHTNDAPGAILRFTDMGIEPYLLASCLKSVLAQRLIRKLCTACSTDTSLSQDDVAVLGRYAGRMEGKTFRAPVGCSECLEGYKGRTGIFELMVINGEMQDLIRSGHANAGVLRETAEKNGMTNLLADGLFNVLEGATSLPEVIKAASPSA